MTRQSFREALRDDPDFAEVKCPECNSHDVALESLFGGAVSELLFFCNPCGSCFTWVKWRHLLPPTAAKPTVSKRIISRDEEENI